MLGGIEHMSVYDLKAGIKKEKNGKILIVIRLKNKMIPDEGFLLDLFKNKIIELDMEHHVKVLIEDENR